MNPEIASLAAGVMTVLVPFARLGAEEFARATGRSAYEKAKNLLGALKSRWAGDEEAADALARFEEKPERYAAVLEDVLLEKLNRDEELATVLAVLLSEMGPNLEVIQEMEEGRRVTGLEAEEMSGGRARVTQRIERGEDVTGAKIERIGPSE